MMDILLISEYIFMFSLAIFALSTIRVAAKKSKAITLAAMSGFMIAMVTILVLIQNIFYISYAKDIAFVFVILGPVGTIAFARALRGDMGC